LYRVEPPTGTNVRHLYRVGWIRPRRASVRAHLYRLMAPTVTNASFVPVEKIPGTNEKSGQGQIPDSLVVIRSVLDVYVLII
jgi:hypothetical protein